MVVHLDFKKKLNKAPIRPETVATIVSTNDSCFSSQPGGFKFRIHSSGQFVIFLDFEMMLQTVMTI